MLKRKKVYQKLARLAKLTAMFILLFILFYLVLSGEHREFKEDFYFTIDIDEQEFIAVCMEWGACFPENYKERKCYFIYPEVTGDLFYSKESCDFQQSVHCFDSLKNYDETDVDCGGSCRGCELGRKCIHNRDCLSTYCHPINEICVNRDGMPSFIVILFYKYPILASLSAIIVPAALLIAFWIKRESERINRDNEKTQKGLISKFNYYSEALRNNIKNGRLKKARQTYYLCMEILSKMDTKSFNAVNEDYQEIKKLYKEVKEEAEKV